MRRIFVGATALAFLLDSEVYSLAVLIVGMGWGLSRFFTAIVQSGKY